MTVSVTCTTDERTCLVASLEVSTGQTGSLEELLGVLLDRWAVAQEAREAIAALEDTKTLLGQLTPPNQAVIRGQIEALLP